MASKRQSALASRHKALGSALGDWNDMDVPWEYDQDVNAEHQAVRTAAGLFDVSGLKKIHVSGPDAFAVLNHLCTRDLSRVYPGKSVYALILDEEGGITDDCILFHIMPNDWLMVHGTGTGQEQLNKSAKGKDVSILFDDNLHDISLQGPKAVGFLDRHTPFDLRSLKYFHHMPTTLFDHHCMISRTGYSGERGYEIFASADHIVPIWDAILEHGKSEGIIPCSFNCIDMVRVEAALLFYPYDMREEFSPWELELGFAVAKNKEADFRGKEACFARKGKEKIKNFGVIADSDQALELEAGVYVDGKQIGQVTAPIYSTVLKQSLAMVQIDPEYAKPGVKVEIKGEEQSCIATTHTLPFYDPEKKKRTEE
ncbi:MAG: aminomethyltransferase family protein [Gammaproteobacteria bacterium]